MQNQGINPLSDKNQEEDTTALSLETNEELPRYSNIFANSQSITRNKSYTDYNAKQKRYSMIRQLKQYFRRGQKMIGKNFSSFQEKSQGFKQTSNYRLIKKNCKGRKTGSKLKTLLIVKKNNEFGSQNIIHTMSTIEVPQSQQNQISSNNKNCYQFNNAAQSLEQIDKNPPKLIGNQDTNIPQIGNGLTSEQILALRNVRMKQFLFDLSMHEDCGKSVQMPSSRYLNMYADVLNLLSNNKDDFQHFSMLLKKFIPNISQEQISITREVIFLLVNFFRLLLLINQISLLPFFFANSTHRVLSPLTSVKQQQEKV
ncbi:UNKNOWN [Stylonychia lemnae]|uniref:Uncharacterized protein n=1 Tax=Stylonychia lemnae TaxID=5949 RepID=A0A078BCU6_STYLE|nr:UNKNOWN [Stylonychia lemnae]|eukprot:CDW91413.1 UNKNOWN [Stylonychia lemnae]